MGRKKVRRHYFSKPETERVSYEQMIVSDSSRTLDRREVMDLVRGGEDSEIEFKVRFSNPEKIINEIIAMANSGGGAILFGVSDTCKIEGLDNPDRIEQDLRIICEKEIIPPVYPFLNKVAFDNGRRVLVLEVNDLRAPHTTRDQKYYIRIGSIKREAEQDEIVELYRRYRPSGFEQIPWTKANIEDIEESFVWNYIKEICATFRKLPEGYPTAQILQDMQLAIFQTDDYIPTLASLLLFGKSTSISKILPRSSVVVTRFSGESISDPIIEQITFVGNLASLYERTEGFLNRYVDLSDQPLQKKIVENSIAKYRSNYSKVAVLEALTNALVHRNYASEGCVRVMIYDQRIEIINPAIIKNIINPAMDSYGLSIPNNPRIKSFLKNLAYGLTTFSGGIPKIRREVQIFVRRDIKIILLPSEFKIEIPGR